MTIKNTTIISFQNVKKVELQRLSSGTVLLWLWPHDLSSVEMIRLEGPDEYPRVEMELNDGWKEKSDETQTCGSPTNA